MVKVVVLLMIIILSLFDIAKATEYTRIVGKLINIDLKNSTIKVQVFSKVCNGVHIFSIQNDKALENLTPSSEIALYLVKDCAEGIVEEK